MAPRWTQIPNQILAEEERKAKAKEWATQQRIPMAESWAEKQRANDPFKRQMSRLEEADAQMGMAPEAETPRTPEIPPYPEMPIEPPAPKPPQPSFMAPTDPNAQLARAEAMQQARRQTVGIKPPVPQPEQPTALASGLLAGARSITPEQMVLKQAPWEQQIAPIQPSPPPPELSLRNPATQFTPSIPRLGETSREIVPGAAGLGDAAGRAGRALEWYQENVVQPTAGAAFASVIDPTNIKPTQSYDEGWAAQGEKWRKAEEPLPGVKGTIEGALDVTNLVPGPGTFKAGAKAGAQLAKRGLEVAPDALRAAGRGINRAADLANQLPAPGLTVEDISKPTSRYYHGTGSAFDTPDAGKFDPNGLYGPGYYMTDSPAVAESYAAGRSIPVDTDEIMKLEGRIADLQRGLQLPELDASKKAWYQEYLAETQKELDRIIGKSAATGPNVRPIDVPAGPFPDGLNLLDAETELAQDVLPLIERRLEFIDDSGFALDRFQEALIADRPTGHDVWNALAHAGENDGEWANTQLEMLGFDGIRYSGGKRIPMRGPDGGPIEHNALVIFPESLSKIRNALSGTPGGFSTAENALQLGAGAAGATAGYDPNLSAEENALRMGLGFVGGAGLSRAALKGRMGLSVEDVTKGKQPWQQTKKEFGVPDAPVDMTVPKYPRLEQLARDPNHVLTEADRSALATVAEAKKQHAKYLREHKANLAKANEHFLAVKGAIEEGLPVPPEVLADYPMLRAPEPPSAISQAGEKQPWEMGLDEYIDTTRTRLSTSGVQKRRLADELADKGITPWRDYLYRTNQILTLDGFKGSHKAVVERALSEGKPVPESVLAEYPKLITSYGPKGTKGQELPVSVVGETPDPRLAKIEASKASPATKAKARAQDAVPPPPPRPLVSGIAEPPVPGRPIPTPKAKSKPAEVAKQAGPNVAQQGQPQQQQPQGRPGLAEWRQTQELATGGGSQLPPEPPNAPSGPLATGAGSNLPPPPGQLQIAGPQGIEANRLPQSTSGAGLTSQTPPPPSIPPNAPNGPIGGGNTTTGGYTGPTRTAGFQQFWDRSRNVIAAQGPAGQELAGEIHRVRDTAQRLAGFWADKMPAVRKLNRKEFTNFVDVAEGKARPLNTMVEHAFTEWQGVREQVYNAAQQVGLDIGRIEDYFPHHFNPDMFKGDQFGKAMDHLVKTGQAATPEEAAQKLRWAQDAIRNRKYSNLEIEREINLPGYDKTPEALFRYIESAANRISQVGILGKDDARAMSLIAKIKDDGYDSSAAKNLFDIAIGAKKYGTNQEQLSGMVRAYNVITKLGLGALTNASQSLNTATVTGGLRVLLNTPKAAFNQEAKDFALKAGITLDGVISGMRESAGWEGKLGKIGAPGFNTVEKFNRVLAAQSGKDYAIDLARQAATGSQDAAKALDTMGLDSQGIIARGGKLNEQEQITAARNIVERTQFYVDPQDLPGWSASPWGKMIMQFRTFSYNQTAFLFREMIQPALKGNVKPLIRFLVYGLPLGIAEVEVQNFLRNRPSEEDPVQAIRQYYQRIGTLGILGDVLAGLAPPNSKYLPGERYALQAAGLALGPTMSTASEGVGSIPTALQGKPTNLERFALKQIPIVGPTLKNTLLPYKPGGRTGAKSKTPTDAISSYLEQQSNRAAIERYIESAAGR